MLNAFLRAVQFNCELSGLVAADGNKVEGTALMSSCPRAKVVLKLQHV